MFLDWLKGGISSICRSSCSWSWSWLCPAALIRPRVFSQLVLEYPQCILKQFSGVLCFQCPGTRGRRASSITNGAFGVLVEADDNLVLTIMNWNKKEGKCYSYKTFDSNARQNIASRVLDVLALHTHTQDPTEHGSRLSRTPKSSRSYTKFITPETRVDVMELDLPNPVELTLF